MAYLFYGEPGDTRASIIILPRMSAYVFPGLPGDIPKAYLPFSVRISSEVSAPIEITSSLGFSPRIGGTIGNWGLYHGALNITLPKIAHPFGKSFMEGHVSVSSTKFEIVLPKLIFTASGYVSEVGSLTVNLLKPRITMEGTVSCVGTLNITIPKPRIKMIGDTGIVGTLNITLPKIEPQMAGTISALGSLTITIPRSKVSMSSIVGSVGVLTVNIPKPTISMSGVVDAYGILSLTIPKPNISMRGIVVDSSGELEEDYLNLVLNIKNNGLTKFTNYNMNSMCNFNGLNLFADANGIYTEGGVQDEGENIAANIRTGLINLELRNKARFKQAWISFKSSGQLTLSVVLPDGDFYEYEVESFSKDEYGTRVKIGKGIRTKYAALDIKNIDGNSFSLDSIRLHYDIFDKKR